MNGFLLIDKDSDWTSFDVCAKIRKTCKTKKVGHTGTLDPFATGLLIVALSKCTKLIPFLEKADKTYETTIELGKTSPTLDPESDITSTSLPQPSPTKEILENILSKYFSGDIKQIPPAFSAIKIKGQKACDLARKGEKVELKPRQTHIFETEILHYEFPTLTIKLKVAAGFYVRSFARDLAEKLDTTGICISLKRTHINNISVENAEKIESFTNPIDPKFILDLSTLEIPTGRIQDFVAGRAFSFPGIEGGKYLILCGGQTFGVGEIICGNLQPRVVI